MYAALACLAQKDLKRLIAFSSVGHMGFVMLGIATLTEIGIQAAIFGMVAHGVITGMLFFCVGSIYDRYHTREIAKIGGGMLQTMPKLGGVFAFVAIASLGLPGLAGFWGEVMALLSSFNPNEVVLGDQVGLFRVFMVMGGIGTVLTAGLLPVDAAAREHGHAARTSGARPACATCSRSSGSRGCRCWSLILVLGFYPRLVFGVTDEAGERPHAACWGASAPSMDVDYHALLPGDHPRRARSCSCWWSTSSCPSARSGSRCRSVSRAWSARSPRWCR